MFRKVKYSQTFNLEGLFLCVNYSLKRKKNYYKNKFYKFCLSYYLLLPPKILVPTEVLVNVQFLKYC